MAAITWRNIDAPSFRDAILAGSEARQSINAGFDSFNKIVDQESKTNIANWDNTAKNNTEKFYADVASQFKTPEEYQAALKSGLVDQMRQQYGAQIDQTGARKYMEERPGILMDRLTKEQAYTDAQTERGQREYINGFKQAIAAASTPEELATLRQGLNTYGSLGHINPVAAASLVDQAVNRGRTLVSDAQAAEKLKSDIEHQRKMERASLMQAQASQTQAGAAVQNANTLEGQRLVEAFSKIDDLAKTPPAVGAYKRGDLTAEGATDTLVKTLTAAKVNPDRISNIVAAVRSLSPDGKFAIRDKDGKEVTRIPIPMSVVEDAAMQANAYSWFDSRAGSKMEKYLLQTLSSKKFQQSAKDEFDASRVKATEQADQLAKLRAAIYPDRKQ